MTSQIISLDGPDWFLGPTRKRRTRPAVVDRPGPRRQAARVPGEMHETLPRTTAWHGSGAPLRRPKPLFGGRYLLRFWAVDYLAEVWLKAFPLRHEGGETPSRLM